jgi:hypothetical protein
MVGEERLGGLDSILSGGGEWRVVAVKYRGAPCGWHEKAMLGALLTGKMGSVDVAHLTGTVSPSQVASQALTRLSPSDGERCC